MEIDDSNESDKSSSLLPPNNSINNLNQSNYRASLTELNDKGKDNFIESFTKTFEFFYKRIINLINDNSITEYPILNSYDNDIESHFDFLREINSIRPNNIIREEVINEKLRLNIFKIVNGGKLDIDSFDFVNNFDQEAFRPNEKKDKKKSNINNIIYFSVGINKLRRKIIALEEIYSKTIKFLINDCKFRLIKDLSSGGDFLIPNIRNYTKRGNKDYYPPYGWIGIGLEVLGKYKENEDDINGFWLTKINKESKWANAYFGFYQEKNNNTNIKISNNIKDYLHELVKNNEKFEMFERKIEFEDKRHEGKKYEKGIYLNPKIENAEKEAGLVTIEDKTFKILLMVRVKIDEISQPKNEDYWVLDKKFIRPYRILFKEKIDKPDK